VTLVTHRPACFLTELSIVFIYLHSPFVKHFLTSYICLVTLVPSTVAEILDQPKSKLLMHSVSPLSVHHVLLSVFFFIVSNTFGDNVDTLGQKHQKILEALALYFW